VSLISIGVPFFNAEKYLELAILSVINQSYKELDIILLDDGSTDKSLEIAERFTYDKRVRVISDGHNMGLPYRLNQLVDISRGKYIARMDADDLVSLERILKQVQFLEENDDVDLVSTGMCSITNDNEVISVRLPSKGKQLNFSVDDGIKGSTGIAHATIMAKKSWYLRNRYDETAKLMEDYQLWIDSLIRNDLKVGFIPEPLYFYREESSIQYKKVIQAYKNQIKVVFGKYRDLIPLKTLVEFYLQISTKKLITRLLNLMGIMNKLILVRNRATEQDPKWTVFVNNEIDKIKSYKEPL
jgi:glycosyltransferase involved in cell wall biosynthesis